MKEQFVTYEIALAFKELGFNEECLAIYTHMNEFYTPGTFFLSHPHPFTIEQLNPAVQDIRESPVYILAPLWQQAIDWFRTKNIVTEVWYDNTQEDGFPWLYEIYVNNEEHEHDGSYYDTLKECREQVILKAIKLYQEGNI